MDIPITCRRCGHFFTSPLILPGESSLFELDFKRLDPQLIAADFSARCPRCSSSPDRNDLYQTAALLSELDKASPSRYEIHALVVAIQKLIDSQAVPNAAVKRIIEEEAPSLTGLRRLIPHDTASIYAFLALLVALAALIEATLADLPTLSKLFSSRHDNTPPPGPRDFSPSPIISPGTPDDPTKWSAWHELMPKLIAADPATSTNWGIRSIACEAVTFLLKSGHIREGRELAQHLYERWQVADANSYLTERAAERLGEAYRAENRLKKAYDIDNLTLSRCREEFGQDSQRTLDIANTVAYDLSLIGNYGASLKLHKEVLIRSRELYGYDDQGTLRYAYSMANALRSARHYTAAFKLDKDTLARRRRILGEDDPYTLNCAHSIANDLYMMRRDDAAFEVYKEVLARRRRVLGEDHSDTLGTAHDMANVLYVMERYTVAFEVYKEVLARRRRVLGEDHSDTLRTAHNMANALYKARRYDEALKVHKEVLARRRRLLGEDHPDTMVSKSAVRSDREGVESFRLYSSFRSHLESRLRKAREGLRHQPDRVPSHARARDHLDPSIKHATDTPVPATRRW